MSAKKKSKRFQSGREILEHYIPGYREQVAPSSTPDPKRGEELAHRLAVEFAKEIRTIASRSTAGQHRRRVRFDTE